jgi:ABC-type branched-subunit amino acid transport system ATPase component
MSLRLSGLDVRHGRIQVCFAIDLNIECGEFVTILGPNGAGKSSLLGAIAGLVESSGSICVDNERLDRLPARVRATRRLAYVPEGRRNLFPALTVEENLRLALRLLERGRRNEMREEIFALFPILRTRLNQLSGTLSGGEQQMLALAAAIARRPAVLLLDEPSQGLAPAVLDEIAAAINRLRSSGLTLVLAEQNDEFAARLTDRFVPIEAGRIVSSHEGEQTPRLVSGSKWVR